MNNICKLYELLLMILLNICYATDDAPIINNKPNIARDTGEQPWWTHIEHKFFDTKLGHQMSLTTIIYLITLLFFGLSICCTYKYKLYKKCGNSLKEYDTEFDTDLSDDSDIEREPFNNYH